MDEIEENFDLAEYDFSTEDEVFDGEWLELERDEKSKMKTKRTPHAISRKRSSDFEDEATNLRWRRSPRSLTRKRRKTKRISDVSFELDDEGFDNEADFAELDEESPLDKRSHSCRTQGSPNHQHLGDRQAWRVLWFEREFDGYGISFGLVNWNIGTGSLQPLLRDFAASEPARWKAVFGNDAGSFWLSSKGTASTKDQLRFAIEQMNTWRVAKGKTTWSVKEPWVTYFKRLSEDPGLQRIQVRYVRKLLDRARYFCEKLV